MNPETSQSGYLPKSPSPPQSLWLTGADVALGIVICFLLVGGPVPDVNEAHYLAKARHYWNPDWCRGDIFLESDNTHLVFYWTLGWITAVLPLTTAAWVLRGLTWAFLAWSMSRLVQTVSPGPFRGAWALGLFTWLMQNFHMAGEWVVGGAEAKGIAYGLVLLALTAVCRNRWNTAWCLLGGASAFHVLVGGWSVLALAVGWLVAGESKSPWRKMLPGLVIGGLLALLGVVPALTTSSASAEVSTQAHRIYVYTRLPHHLVIHRFQPAFWWRFGGLTLLAAALAWPLRRECGMRRLSGFALGAVGIAVVGLAIDQSLLTRLDLAAKLLRFYWYRLSDFAIPLLATIALLSWHARLTTKKPAAAAVWMIVLIWGPILWWVNHRPSPELRQIPGADRQTLLHRLQDESYGVAQYVAWRDCCQWVRDNTPEGTRFLTPRTQQTFKFYAHRAEVANWKDIPQDAESIVQWHRRLRQIYPPKVSANGLVRHSDRRLLRLTNRYDADYIVVRRRSRTRRLDPQQFRQVYPNREWSNPYFQVFEVQR